jgi:7-cyano-7-deazaguanine synthase
MQAVLLAASPRLRRNKLEIQRPLRDMRKPEVVALAAAIGVPLELTWSCHRDGEKHCWKCPGCKARAAAFKTAGVRDPLKPKRRSA